MPKRQKKSKAVSQYDKSLKRGDSLTPASPNEQPLLPWQATFAEWLAYQPKRPPLVEQVEKAEELAQHPVTDSALRALKNRARFREYWVALQREARVRARAMLEARLPKYVEAHEAGLDLALANNDYRALPAFTGPIIDRIWPKQEQAVQATQINITLTPAQAEAMELDEAEVLDAEIVDYRSGS